MLNSKNLAIVKEFGDKIEFTILRFHCIHGNILPCMTTIEGSRLLVLLPYLCITQQEWMELTEQLQMESFAEMSHRMSF